jgi:hypothetical protein
MEGKWLDHLKKKGRKKILPHERRKGDRKIPSTYPLIPSIRWRRSLNKRHGEI